MKWIANILFLIAALVAFNGHADVVRFEQLSPEAEPRVLSQPYLMSASSAKVYVSSATGQSIRLTFKDYKDEIVASRDKQNVDFNDTFVINGTTYFGAIFTVDNLPEGPLTLTVERGTFDQVNEFTSAEYQVLVDLTPPSITGDFFWDGSTSYWRIHTDGKFVVSLASVRQAGFQTASAGLSGYSHATFSSEFLDGPNVGKLHANNLPALLTSDGRLVIGTGAEGSISTAYVPANTAAQMRFTFRLHNKAGHVTEKSIDLYVATRATPTKPSPYGVFTGVSTVLDGIPAFTGFVPYTPGMTVNTNPVRMIYRANRNHYFGGGGDADLYGGWVNSARNTNRIVHMDEQFIYFDITGSTNGNQINEGSFYIRDLASWRRYFFEHQLTLGEAIRPPKATEIAYYQQGADRWFSHPSSLTTYITKDNIQGENDSITKIRVTVEPRAYTQRFSFDFNPSGIRYQSSCLIPEGETQCVIETNLPYPGNDIGTYHNRHRISGVGNSLVSDELVSNWMYDGSPASVEQDSIQHDPLSKTVTFTVKKDHVTKIWSTSQIRSVRLAAAPVSSPTQRINLTQLSLSSQQINGTQYNTYTFSYGNLADGQYSFHANIEDGFSSSAFRHKREHNILSVTSLDLTPPVINANLTPNKPVTSLTSIRVNLTDSSNAFVRSMLITGGPDNVNIALPYRTTSLKEFRAQYIYLNPTEDTPYTLTITASDTSGNQSSKTYEFLYQPPLTRIPDTKLPAISSPLRNPKGVPSNVIVTPQIRNSEGAPARGVHQVYFTLTPSAQTPLKVNGQTVSPGQTISFDANLSITNHRLRLEVYPEAAGEVTENNFQIHVPNIKVTLCPVNFVETGTQCVFLNFKETTKNCPPGFNLNGSNCENHIVYEPTTSCADGYTLDGLTCKGSYKIPPVSTCPTGYGLVDKNTCQRLTTVEAKTCPAGQILEDGMCKDEDGNFTNTGIYCSGHDVSNGPHCADGICTTYNPNWNACEISTPAVSLNECSSGTLSGNECIVQHQYNLNVSCPFGFNREGLNCTRLEIVDPIKSCDDGWQLTSTGCIQQEFAPFTSCPATHALINGRCHHLQDVTITCPATFTWDGTACTRVVVDAATPVCPEGYEWTGTTCRRQETVPATPVCPLDYSWSSTNSRCETTLTQPGTPVCPSGYSWSSTNARCEQPQSQSATPNCASGYSWNGSTCTRTDTQAATPVCASGYSWNGSTCSTTETTPATSSCPSGYSLSGSQCVRNETQAATPVCASGYTWNGSTCARTNTQSATPVCASGYSWNGSTCVRPETTTANASCPSGYTLSGSQCVRNESQSATPVCASGYSWNGSTCVRPETTAANASCPSGYSLSGSQCVRNETQSATPVCASGYSWNGSTCVRPETTAANASCPSGYSLSGSQCVRNETQAATPVCASGYTWNGSNCSLTQTQSSSLVCPPGTTQEIWGTCYQAISSGHPIQCQSGSSPAFMIGWGCYPGGAFWNPATPMIMTCPSGQTALVSSSSSSPTYSCNTTPSKVHQCPAGWVLTGSTCTQTLTQSPTSYSCPSGWSLSGSQCNRTLTATPTYSCASGWTLSGTSCNRTLTQAPSSYTCPSGWTVSGSQCNRTLTATPTYSCASGWTLSATSCNRTLTQAPSSYTCPSGWTVSGSQCNRTLTATPTYSCASGWTLSGTSCNRTLTQAPSSYSCPSGWTLSGTNCNQTVTQAPSSYTCPSGWTVSGSQCNRTLTATPAYSCSSGWTLSGTNCNRTFTQAPTSYTCPSGFTLSGTSCNRTLTQSPTSYSCPSGWSLSGSSCNRTLTSSPSSYTCPSGWTVNGSNCNQIQSSPPSSYSCLTGWDLSSTSCNRYVYTDIDAYVCLDGWDLNGNQCSTDETVDETRSCKPAYSMMNQDLCSKDLPDDFVGNCESGWTPLATQCLHTHSKSFNLSCNAGFTLNQQQCHRTLQQPVNVACQSGDTFVDGQCRNSISTPVITTCDSPFVKFDNQCRHRIQINNFDQI